MKLKNSRNKIMLAALAILLGQSYMVARPAFAFWFFRHKKEANNLALTPANIEPIYPGATVLSGTNRRLVPSYFNKNVKTVQPQSGNHSSSRVVSDTIPNKFSSNSSNNVSSNSNNLSSNSSGNFSTDLSIYKRNTIKIGIGFNITSSKIVVLDGAQLIDNTNGQIIAYLPAQSQWVLTLQNNYLALKPDRSYYLVLQQLASSCVSSNPRIIPTSYTIESQSLTKYPSTIKGLPSTINNLTNDSGYTLKSVTNQDSQPGLLALNGRLYRGNFLIKLNKSKNDSPTDITRCDYSVINSLDLEDYLLSVVPSEMPSLWPIEALKAQAIAARSYALANLGKHGSAGYDLKDNIEDQVYLGVKSETEPSTQAVNSTRGLVMKYDGKPICAYFHSASGGGTERAENVWHSCVPYLKAVIDFDQEAPLYNWTKNYSIMQTESGLPKDLGQILSISILAKSPSGRARYLLINGTNNSRIISGEAARKCFSLPSANFNVTPDETAYIFAGKGFGHGLGLSQWGAKALAQHGYNAAQILCYYYDGISIDF